MEKTPWQKLFDPNFLGSWSLGDGEVLITTVTKCEIKEVKNSDGKAKPKIVAHLSSAPKNGILLPNGQPLPMIIGNKENARAMETLSGSINVEDWVNVPIEIYVKHGVRGFGGEYVDALRIRKPLSPANNELKELKRKVRDAFAKYQADDRNGISEQLNAGINNTDPKFWKDHLTKLTAKPATK